MGRNVNNYLLYFYFSSEQNKDNNIPKDFIEFFKNYFLGKNFTEEVKFNLRFYIFLLHSYISNLKLPNKELFNSWDIDIKQFLLKKYSFEPQKQSKIIQYSNNNNNKNRINRNQSYNNYILFYF